MTKQEIAELINRYRAGNCSGEEKALIEDSIWYYNEHNAELSEDQLQLIQEELRKRLPGMEPKKVTIPTLMSFVAAAVAIITVAVFFYYQQGKLNPKEELVEGIRPGGYNATLTLANGKQIDLNAPDAESIARKNGLQIKRNAHGLLEYEVLSAAIADEKPAATEDYHTITTPKGGQYIVTLPDGSKIWLNAATVFKYPVNFVSRIRKVTVSGEAYFEIAKDKNRPFIVSSAGQEVTVLGTHFNVSAYSDEVTVKTTLLEGAVRVSHKGQSITLKPNEQSSLKEDKIMVMQVDPAEAVAWKNGEFVFDQEPLADIMNKLSRWYDVEVVYQEEKLKQKTFSGSVSRFEKVSELLHMLESTEGVHFRIEGRRVLVMK